MKPFENPIYKEDISSLSLLNIDFEKFSEKTILISGSTGLIGSCLIDALMEHSECSRIIALGRNEGKARSRFDAYWDDARFSFLRHDVNERLPRGIKADYVIHLASCTHPVAYATKPIDTILTNIEGTRNMIESALENPESRFIFASSNEIYGENRGDVVLFDEKYCGYIDSNTLRAGYPESKRCGETLCQAYRSQYGQKTIIARITRCFGPTLLEDDSKAMSQFIRNAIKGENIVLKSKGEQYYSYIYVVDAVSAMLSIMLNGEDGEAYNISNPECDVKLKDLAKTIADIAGTEVVFETPNETEKAGFSKATVARLDSKKLRKIGWTPKYDIGEAIRRTIECLQ